jgi:hypothetical protein
MTFKRGKRYSVVGATAALLLALLLGASPYGSTDKRISRNPRD